MKRLEAGERVAVLVEIPIDGSPAALEPPEGYPFFCALQATTYPEWKPLHGDEDTREGSWVQYPALIVTWGKS